jgi:hypothetical protein
LLAAWLPQASTAPDGADPTGPLREHCAARLIDHDVTNESLVVRLLLPEFVERLALDKNAACFAIEHHAGEPQWGRLGRWLSAGHLL